MRRSDRRDRRETASAELQDQRKLRDAAWLMAGLGIGSAVALLLAPASGEDIRYAIGRGCRKAAKRIGRHTEELRDRAEDLLERAQDLRERGARLFLFRNRGEVLRRYRGA